MQTTDAGKHESPKQLETFLIATQAAGHSEVNVFSADNMSYRNFRVIKDFTGKGDVDIRQIPLPTAMPAPAARMPQPWNWLVVAVALYIAMGFFMLTTYWKVNPFDLHPDQLIAELFCILVIIIGWPPIFLYSRRKSIKAH